LIAGSGSGSRRAKITHEYRESKVCSCFWSAGCSLLRAEGFSCSLCDLYGDLRISKLNFNLKNKKKISSCKCFSIFGHQNPKFGIVSGSEYGSGIIKNAGSGSAINQCGSTTLQITSVLPDLEIKNRIVLFRTETNKILQIRCQTWGKKKNRTTMLKRESPL
jgi:hypothetical protein